MTTDSLSCIGGMIRLGLTMTHFKFSLEEMFDSHCGPNMSISCINETDMVLVLYCGDCLKILAMNQGYGYLDRTNSLG